MITYLPKPRCDVWTMIQHACDLIITIAGFTLFIRGAIMVVALAVTNP